MSKPKIVKCAHCQGYFKRIEVDICEDCGEYICENCIDGETEGRCVFENNPWGELYF